MIKGNRGSLLIVINSPRLGRTNDRVHSSRGKDLPEGQTGKVCGWAERPKKRCGGEERRLALVYRRTLPLSGEVVQRKGGGGSDLRVARRVGEA